MLSSATCRLRRSQRLTLPRRVPVPPSQPYLNFLDLPVPETCLWGQLADQEKTAVIEILTRLMVKAALASNRHQEKEHD